MKNEEVSATSAHSAVTSEFALGETVWSAIAAHERGMVTGIILRADHAVYLVVWSDLASEKEHQAIELSREPLYHQSTR